MIRLLNETLMREMATSKFNVIDLDLYIFLSTFHAFQDVLELAVQSRMLLNFPDPSASASQSLGSQSCITMTVLMWCWGLNPGHRACQVHTLTTEQ